MVGISVKTMEEIIPVDELRLLLPMSNTSEITGCKRPNDLFAV
jgi:hypothetical protein